MPGAATRTEDSGLSRRHDPFWLASIFVLLCAAKLCHSGVLWTEETLPLAAADQVLRFGKTLYGQVWFDKPPLTALAYLLWAAQTGWILRLAGALHSFAACWIIYRFAWCLWGRPEARVSSGLLAFSLIFYLPSAVIPLASDFWMLVPHLAAVWMAAANRPALAGFLAGIAFLFNPKGLFVLAACFVFHLRGWWPIAAGFLVVNLAALGALAATGVLNDYWREVWVLGQFYATDTFLPNPIGNGLQRTLNWFGFHAVPFLLALLFLLRKDEPHRFRFLLWTGLSVIAICSGWRFFPRYFFQLLPVLCLAAGRGWTIHGRRIAPVLLLLLIPFVRFGPRYAMLATDLLRADCPQWSDLAMDRDSRKAAAKLLELSNAGDGRFPSLFVWGYRPELYLYTGFRAAAPYLESQPLTGVFADRHLSLNEPSLPSRFTASERQRLIRTQPDWIADGLTPLNPAMSPYQYPELAQWLQDYEEAARIAGFTLYRRKN